MTEEDIHIFSKLLRGLNLSDDEARELYHFSIEDNSDAWVAQIALEESQRRQEEEENQDQPSMSVTEIIERLNKAKTILDVSDARIEFLTATIQQTVERLKRKQERWERSIRQTLKNKKV